MEEEIKIVQSKKKILFLITYNSIIIIIAVLMFIFANLLYFHFLTIIAKVMASIFIFVFGYNIINLFIQYRKPKTLITINKEGIYDNTTYSIVAFMPWENIKSIQLIRKEFETKKEKITKAYIAIELKQINEPSDEVKIKMENNMEFFGVPIILDIENSDEDTEKFYCILEKYMDDVAN
ncbi:MAG: hypothetical protein PHP54_00750 [Clostridia bacterium]|nr:hypothetical protein [Clostridia bacterium]